MNSIIASQSVNIRFLQLIIHLISISRIMLVHYFKCCNLTGYSTCYLCIGNLLICTDKLCLLFWTFLQKFEKCAYYFCSFLLNKCLSSFYTMSIFEQIYFLHYALSISNNFLTSINNIYPWEKIVQKLKKIERPFFINTCIHIQLGMHACSLQFTIYG